MLIKLDKKYKMHVNRYQVCIDVYESLGKLNCEEGCVQLRDPDSVLFTRSGSVSG